MEQIKPAGDAVPAVNASTLSVEHDRTLRALQSEINYHREHDEQGSYMDKAIKVVMNSSADSLHNLEIAYDAEKEKPNSVSRESVIAAVKEDQSKMKGQDSAEWAVSGLSSLALFLAGGRYGKALGTAAMAATAMHPNDSIGKQALEGLVGVGQGLIASQVFSYGMSMRNAAVGVPLAFLSYPVFGASGRLLSYPHDRQASPLDPEMIYGAPLPAQTPGSSVDGGASAPNTAVPRGPYDVLAPNATASYDRAPVSPNTAPYDRVPVSPNTAPNDRVPVPPTTAPRDNVSAPPTAVPRAPSDWYK